MAIFFSLGYLLIALNDEGWFFLLKDHLGSTRAVLNESNSVVTSYDYMPFGNIMRSSVNTDVSYQFTGQEYDTELSLHNFRARFYDSDLGMFYAVDPAGQNYSPFSYTGNNPIVYLDKDGQWFGIDDLIVSGVSFISGYFSHGLSTGNWGGEALKSGLISAGTSWLAYNTGGAAAGLLFDPGSAGYAITASTVAGAVGGSTGSVANQLRYTDKVNWNLVGRSTISGIGGGLAGGLTGQYLSADPILPGIVGGFVGGGIEGSYTGNTWNGAMQGAWWGGVSSSLTVKAYKMYGEYLSGKYSSEMQSKYGLGRCKGFCDALSEMGVDLPNAEFGDFSDPTHVGKVLGGDIYGNHYILSQEGAGPISVLTGRQLSIGYGTAAIPGTYFNPYTQTNQYWGGYGIYRIVSGRKYYWR